MAGSFGIVFRGFASIGATLLVAACGGGGASDTTSTSDSVDAAVTPPPATTTTVDEAEGTVAPDEATTTTDSGRPAAPDFTLALGDGGEYTLSEGSKPVYMIFWAEW